MGKLRREYLFVYDIEDTKKRNKIFDRLKDFGLKPIQKSVFVGEMNFAEKCSVIRDVKKILNDSDDKVLLIPVTVFGSKDVFLHGHKMEEFEEKDYGTV